MPEISNDLSDRLATIHDELADLIQTEQHPDGTYETDAIEVDLDDLIRWRDVIKLVP